MSEPLLVLGVRRSGTTLLRVILDRHSRLAVPDESYFVPQLAARHGRRPDIDAFVDDLRRLPTLVEWDVDAEAVRARLRQGDSLGRAVSAVYEAYADRQGKERWGDKTPMYMGYLPLLERLFPDARYVHLIRDGRDAAMSFLEMPGGIVTRTWAHPRDPAGFAAQWRSEVLAARALGGRVGRGRYLEVRYEELVREPSSGIAAICEFAGLPFEEGMLAYAGEVDVSRKPHQQSLAKPPTPGLRDWRTRMSSAEIAAFEGVAGDLLYELGYELGSGPPRTTGTGRVTRASYAVRSGAWRLAGRAVQRSPLWRRRHPPLR